MSRAVKRQPKLKSRYKGRVEEAIEYVRTIEDFDNLVDPQTLAFYCLGLEPFAFVLHNIEIEEKKSVNFVNVDFLAYILLLTNVCMCVFSFRNDDKV